MESILDRPPGAKAMYGLGAASVVIWRGTRLRQKAVGGLEGRNEAREVGRGQFR